MRILVGAVLLASPLLMSSIAATPASADQMIQELRSTWAQSHAAADPSAETPAVEQRAEPGRESQAAKRHRVAGSTYRREHTSESSVHG